MSHADIPATTLESGQAPPAPALRVFQRLLRRPVAVVAIIIILTIYLAGILAPVAAPHGFNEIELGNGFAGPSLDHPFGTDRLGRDLLSRAMWSAQTTVIISVAAMATGGLVLGVGLGLLAGYSRGWRDAAIMRSADAFASVPTILLLLIINVTLKDRVIDVFRDVEDFTGIDWLVSSGAPTYFLVFGALAIFGWVGTARIVRSQVLSLRESNYVLAAKAEGASTVRILVRHLLPNIANLLIVGITAGLGAMGTAEVGLSFLGIGVQAPHPSFGVMIFDGAGLSNLRAHPQLLLVPASVVILLFISFNLLGDVLTDVLSPRRR